MRHYGHFYVTVQRLKMFNLHLNLKITYFHNLHEKSYDTHMEKHVQLTIVYLLYNFFTVL